MTTMHEPANCTCAFCKAYDQCRERYEALGDQMLLVGGMSPRLRRQIGVARTLMTVCMSIQGLNVIHALMLRAYGCQILAGLRNSSADLIWQANEKLRHFICDPRYGHWTPLRDKIAARLRTGPTPK